MFSNNLFIIGIIEDEPQMEMAADTNNGCTIPHTLSYNGEYFGFILFHRYFLVILYLRLSVLRVQNWTFFNKTISDMLRIQN